MVNIVKHSHKKSCACATAKDAANHTIRTVATGEKGTLDYRVSFKNSENVTISPWHSIPLYAGQGLLNFVCEIPRNSSAKFEVNRFVLKSFSKQITDKMYHFPQVATNESGNPIKQDSKKGKPRSYAIDILWNYGMLPQV